MAALPPTPAPSLPGGVRAGSSEGSWPRACVGSATLANFGKGSENQDSFVASANGSKCFVGVFDGHGLRGKHMSEFAKDSISKNLLDSSYLHTNPKQALEGAYQATQRDVERRRGLEAAESGTTAVAAYQHRDKLFVANVGDSRAVLGRCSGDSNGAIRAVDLSTDHKPSREDERRRIIAAGGRVDQSMFPMRTARGGMQWVRVGPERVMTKDGMGGLAMSRSLGDLRLRPAVISVPEMQERQLDSRDKVVVLGSDGVWDHVSSQEAVDIAARRDNPTAAAKEIAATAKRRWLQDTEGQLTDDITAVVVRFDHRARSSSGARPSSGASLFTATARSDAGSGVLRGPPAPPFAASGERPRKPAAASGRPLGAQVAQERPWPSLPAVERPPAGAAGRARPHGQWSASAGAQALRGQDARARGPAAPGPVTPAAAGRPTRGAR